PTGRPEALPRAIPALASLARSAGQARLRFFRDNAGPDVARGFLLDRSRLLAAPLGLRSAVRIGMAHTSDEAGAEQQLWRAVLGGLSRFPSLGPPAILDSPPPGGGLSSADPAIDSGGAVSPQNQLRH